MDGVVLTNPYYAAVDNEQMVNWHSKIADLSPYPLYLYDLAVVTKTKITLPVIDRLIKHPNIKGIKTADWEMIQAIGRKYPDAAFACTPNNGRKMFACLEKDDFKGAREHLDNILLLRDTMIAQGLMRSFTYCMNQIGCEGNFHQDYCLPITEKSKEILRETMHNIGEI